MREIKFRAWDKKNEQMLSWDELKQLDYHRQFTLFEDSNYIFLQDTGLKDKNGKEIYEGYILKIWDDYEEVLKIVSVSYQSENGYPAFDVDDSELQMDFEANVLSSCDNGDYQCEVIGNIYENPELLNK